jgi:hypothetical protein
MRFSLIFCWLAMALSACAQVPAASLSALSRIEIENSDPAKFRIAIIGPDALRIRDGDASIDLQLVSRADASTTNQHIPLAVATGSVGSELAGEVGAGERITLLTLLPQDAMRLRSFQELARAAKQNGKSTGSLAVSVGGCLERQTPQALLYSVFVKTEETGRFVPLVRKVDVRKLVQPGSIEGAKLCAA